MQQNLLFDLPHISALTLHGSEAKSFLQGQISCDVSGVNATHIERGAFCNLKGRILALADVIEWQHELMLILPQNLIEKTNKSLSKTACLSRVSLNENTNIHALGFYLKDEQFTLPIEGFHAIDQHACIIQDNVCAYHLGNGFYIILTESIETYRAMKTRFEKEKALKDNKAWHLYRLLEGDVQIYPESRGLFLPHRLGLHNKGYLSFDKGCYKGQEIIARTHYRAKLKHGLHTFPMKTTHALSPGLRLMTEDGQQELGELVDFCPMENDETMLAASMLLDAFDTPFIFAP